MVVSIFLEKCGTTGLEVIYNYYSFGGVESGGVAEDWVNLKSY